jgi:serine O-acetyltransferase
VTAALELLRAAERLSALPPLSSAGGALPDVDQVVGAAESLRRLIIARLLGGAALTEVHATFASVAHVFEPQIERSLAFASMRERTAHEIVTQFLDSLPDIAMAIAADARAALDGDPAATCIDEVLVAYPGLIALAYHRLAHRLHRLGAMLIPRILAEHAHARTGIDIHPEARLGGSLFIDHGTGVVIGQTCRIGERVRIYQGVTLGARRFDTDAAGRPIDLPRHPIVEDDVVIYAGATVLGRITIGAGSIIGGNVWLVKSVPPGTRLVASPSRSDRFESGSGI